VVLRRRDDERTRIEFTILGAQSGCSSYPSHPMLPSRYCHSSFNSNNRGREVRPVRRENRGKRCLTPAAPLHVPRRERRVEIHGITACRVIPCDNAREHTENSREQRRNTRARARAQSPPPRGFARRGTINFSANLPGDQTNRLGQVANVFFNPLRSSARSVTVEPMAELHGARARAATCGILSRPARRVAARWSRLKFHACVHPRRDGTKFAPGSGLALRFHDESSAFKTMREPSNRPLRAPRDFAKRILRSRIDSRKPERRRDTTKGKRDKSRSRH